VRPSQPSRSPARLHANLGLAGYGNAALHLSRCWVRDPETLPFAKNVQPHTLVNLVQDGLWFDKLQAEAANVRMSPPHDTLSADHNRPSSATTLAATMATRTRCAMAPS